MVFLGQTLRRYPGRRINHISMKTIITIARVLLGAVFVVFGLNAFLNFIPLPPPQGAAGSMMTILFTSHYLYAVKVFEISGGLLLITGRFAALGLTLVGPVVVNILFFDFFLDRSGLPLGLFIGALAAFLLIAWRQAFAGLVGPRPAAAGSAA
jgi:putative oxidoreductase